ncbi:17495_t:CDS:1 [Acaulospora morrowiae]|uniref:17495_t:CDS:1 n=1 Tax=Acaulospora morrowiae TaxID=94023 RepID=A0A9N9CXF3_9GLOM|nr:17495_t:CDS:1 [Acaulospora morrowiae]
MNQETLNGLPIVQKTNAKYISFARHNLPPSFSGVGLVVYDNSNMNGDLSFAQFPNLMAITIQNQVIYSNLNSIDISENENFWKLDINSNFNYYCKIIVKERQLNRVLVSYVENGVCKKEKLKNQCQIPYYLVEDRKLEQLETEVKKLKQDLAEKNQQIKDLQTEAKKKPTLYQFEELNKVVFPDSELNYVSLKEEIKRLKLKDFAPYFRQQKDRFDQLTLTSKNKAADNLKPILELFLQTRKQIIEQNNRNGDDFAKGQLQGQLVTCQTLLQSKFTQEELQTLLNMQEEILKLEEQSNSLRG